jgi:hypothetical protein
MTILLIMNIIPEEPEQYLDTSRPTPSLSALLSKRQFEFYMKASTSHLYGFLHLNYHKRTGHAPQKAKELRRTLRPTSGMNQKSLVYLGIGFGILAITKLVKNLSNNS